MPSRSHIEGEPERRQAEVDEDTAYELMREEQERAAYDEYVDRLIDEWRETGIRPKLMPFRGGR